MTLAEFNLLKPEAAKTELFSCCGSDKWVSLLMKNFPFSSLNDLEEKATAAWCYQCIEADWLQAFSHHPKIGDKKSLQKKFAGKEQESIAAASDETISELAQANAVYEEKNGFIFIVCATGKPADEMLQILKSRLQNSREEELHMAMNEQHKITLIRLGKLFSDSNFQTKTMSQLTTHVLDTSIGRPAKDVAVKLLQKVNAGWQAIAQGVTNADGRISDLLPPGKKMETGVYKIVFDTGSYFTANKVKGFYPEVEIQFIVSDDTHYHVPLLINPFGYSTYRGS